MYFSVLGCTVLSFLGYSVYSVLGYMAHFNVRLHFTFCVGLQCTFHFRRHGITRCCIVNSVSVDMVPNHEKFQVRRHCSIGHVFPILGCIVDSVLFLSPVCVVCVCVWGGLRVCVCVCLVQCFIQRLSITRY